MTKEITLTMPVGVSQGQKLYQEGFGKCFWESLQFNMWYCYPVKGAVLKVMDVVCHTEMEHSLEVIKLSI